MSLCSWINQQSEKKGEEKKGIASLILSIASIVANFVANTDWDLFWPVHVVGLILGIVGLVLGAAGRKNATQRGVATAGMIIGIVGVSLNAIFMLACASAYATASNAVDSLLG